MSKKHSKAKNRDGSFFAIPKVVLNHPDFLKMTWAAQALLIHMGAFYNGFNNGDLAIPLSIMRERGWWSGTLQKAKAELIAYDWIRITRKGNKFYLPDLFAFTWKELDDCKGKLDPYHLWVKRSLKT